MAIPLAGSFNYEYDEFNLFIKDLPGLNGHQNGLFISIKGISFSTPILDSWLVHLLSVGGVA
jgi:hypothetical protein